MPLLETMKWIVERNFNFVITETLEDENVFWIICYLCFINDSTTAHVNMFEYLHTHRLFCRFIHIRTSFDVKNFNTFITQTQHSPSNFDNTTNNNNNLVKRLREVTEFKKIDIRLCNYLEACYTFIHYSAVIHSYL